MIKVYMLRHGQTEFNLKKLVQGRCDSPLTALGREQARVAGEWLAKRDVTFSRMYCSPLGRTRETLDVVREVLADARSNAALPPVTFAPGLVERSYAHFEGGPVQDVPADVWDPGEMLVPYGGEGSQELRRRMVSTLREIASDPRLERRSNVLCVSHGSACLQFKQAWEDRAECAQNVPLGNCCILVYRYESEDGSFVCEQIVNQV